MGFLYQCIQDQNPETGQDRLLLGNSGTVEPVKSDLRLRLERAEMSEGVIVAAEGGHYTSAQLDQLVGLKQELQQTIVDQLQGSQINEAVEKLSIIAHSASTTCPSSQDAASDSMADNGSSRLAECSFRACHSCRPYYRERVFISFQAVLAGDFAPLTWTSSQALPIKSSHILRTIGTAAPSLPSALTLSTLPSALPTGSSFPYSNSTESPTTASTESSQFTLKTTQTAIDAISGQGRPRRRFYGMGRRTSGDIARDLSRLPSFFRPQGLKTAIQTIFRLGRESSSSGSSVTLPLPRTGRVRDLQESPTVGEFDLGALRRVRKQTEKNAIKDGTYTGGFEDVDAVTEEHSPPEERVVSFQGDEEGSGSNVSAYSCVSEGSEVEVDGDHGTKGGIGLQSIVAHPI